MCLSVCSCGEEDARNATFEFWLGLASLWFRLGFGLGLDVLRAKCKRIARALWSLPPKSLASGGARPTIGTNGQESCMHEDGGKMKNASIDVLRHCLSRRLAPGRRTGPCSSGIK